MDSATFSMGDACYQDVCLPAEVVSVLPQDPYLQLELSHKIACFAYSQQVGSLD